MLIFILRCRSNQNIATIPAILIGHHIKCYLMAIKLLILPLKVNSETKLDSWLVILDVRELEMF